MKKLFAKSRGQIVVLYAGMLSFALLGAVALGSDVAVMYVNWMRLQRTADAAAIAGATFLSSDISFGGTIAPGCSGDNAEEAACTYAVNNGVSLDPDPSVLAISEPSANTLKVVAKAKGLPYFFAKALGMKTYDLSVTAEAVAPGVVGTVLSGPGATGLFPVGLQCDAPCSGLSTLGGEPVHFGTKFVGGLATGNWQWLDVSGGHGGGVPVLVAAIANGASGTFSIYPPNNKINTETGNVGQNPNVAKALSDRLSKCPTLTDQCNGLNPNDIPLGDPCEVIVPAVDFTGLHGKSTALTIYGFGLILLDPATTTSTNINGCFVSEITQKTLASSTAPNFGALVADVLTQ